MFEAVHAEEIGASPEAVWALWEDPARWPDWNSQLESAELDGTLALGGTVAAKLRRGGRMEFEIVALEAGRVLGYEARLPGARLGHSHRLEPRSSGCEVEHRIYVRGLVGGLWAPLLSRRRQRALVEEFAASERTLTEAPVRKPRKSRGRAR